METLSAGLLTFLLNSLWQIPLIAAIAALVCGLMRRGPAAHRHAIWVATIVSAAAIPLVSIHSSGQSNGARAVVDNLIEWSIFSPASTASTVEHPLTPRVSGAKPRGLPLPPFTASSLLITYLIFLLFRLTGFAVAAMQTIRIRARGVTSDLPQRTATAWSHCRQVMGVRKVMLLTSARIAGPVTVGNAIILPHSMLTEPDEDVLTTAIGHEMAHVARRDFFLNLIYELLYLPVSFHPAAWVIHRAIQRTRELACDELVTQRLLNPGAYARSIMVIAAGMSGHNSPGYTLGVFDGDILEERIRRLMERPAATLKRARLFLAGGLSALGVCAIAASGLAISARAQGAAASEMKLGVEDYNRGDFGGAIGHFENAATLEPANVNVKLFLASSYVRAFVTDKTTRSNPGNPLILHAREQYQQALRLDPRNAQAVNGMIAVCLDTNQFREARTWAARLMDLDSRDKQAYYQLGFIDFIDTSTPVQKARMAAGIQPRFTSHGRLDATDPATIQLPDRSVRKALQEALMPQIADGLRMLQTALQLDPNYGAAMSYIGQLLRVEASLVDDPSLSLDLVRQSNEWMNKTEAAFKTHPPSGQAAPINADGAAPVPSVSVRM